MIRRQKSKMGVALKRFHVVLMNKISGLIYYKWSRFQLVPYRSGCIQSTARTSDLFSSVALPPAFCVCGSDTREKYVISLTWNVTEANWSASCQSSVIIFPQCCNWSVWLFDCMADRLGERWYAKWRHGVSSGDRGGCPQGLGWGQQHARTAQASSTAVCALVCVLEPLMLPCCVPKTCCDGY